ncbi:undecaprenyl-phosphate glucose phosphotransferase [Xylophilus sp.]|uniref:undecaprenyl-phosphate glucose phosphotransferase n=1 Tax=Xylophilus sp. TaxID=2653893 RepID=UPI0013B8F3D9|nr:undecaprenyl-phosphate glucose phosphotransferase [Xylophilus sp.]KAF1045993.1 MAG: UDP-glucose:undecaprenyl-phosphate glucose-1-phosphate transferase [Xylophilus sp.]
MPERFSSAPPSRHAALFHTAVSLGCAAAVGLSLLLCVAAYRHAEFATFDLILLLGMGASAVAFGDIGRFLLGVRVHWLRLLWLVVQRWGIVFFLTVFAIYLGQYGREVSRLVMVAWLLLTPPLLAAALVLGRRFAVRLYSAPQRRRRAVFVFLTDEGRHLAENFQRAPVLGVRAVGYVDNRLAPRPGQDTVLPRLGSVAEAQAWIAAHPVDMVFIGVRWSHTDGMAPLVEALLDSVASVYFLPDFALFGVRNLQPAEIAGTPLLVAYDTPFLGLARVAKRASDLVMASVLLLLASPLMLVAAVGVRLSSPGPILFKQKRYGAGGTEISVYKFRSMRVEPPPPDGTVRQATQDDPRVTPFGRFLRRTSIDELPQFLNVLGGSMSIVGPRPHAVQHNEFYRRRVRGYMLRHQVKPGITGWAQVNGLRGETATLDRMKKRVEYDLYYIRNWSLMLDFRIILMTILLVVRDKNAY